MDPNNISTDSMYYIAFNNSTPLVKYDRFILKYEKSTLIIDFNSINNRISFHKNFNKFIANIKNTNNHSAFYTYVTDTNGCIITFTYINSILNISCGVSTADVSFDIPINNDFYNKINSIMCNISLIPTLQYYM